MIAGDFSLNLGGFFSQLKVAETAVSGMKLSTPSLALGGLSDAGSAVRNMTAALTEANSAATPLAATLDRAEAGLHGIAAVSRVASTAIRVLPGLFEGIHPAVTKTFSAVSLASRGFDVLRGRLSPLGGIMAFIEMRNLGVARSYSALAATVGVASSAIVTAGRNIGTAARSIGAGLASAIGAVEISLGPLLGPLLGLASIASIISAPFVALGASIKSGANLEGLQSEFAVMLGSLDKAKSLTAEINQFAGTTPFSTAGLAGNSKTLLAFGAAGGTVMPTLKMLGDVAGSSQEKLDSLTLAFAQVSAAGKLTGGDLLQFVNAGFNPLQEISAKTGKSMADLRKEMEAGAISSAMVADAFKTATAEGGRFFNNTITQSKTWNGMLSSIGDNVSMAFAAFGMPVIDSLKPMLANMVGYTSGLAETAGSFGAAVAGAFALVSNAFGSGQFGDLVSLSLQIGFAKSVNFLIAATRGWVAMMVAGFDTAPGRLMSGLSALFNPSLWAGLSNVMKSIAEGFIAVLSSGLAPLINKLISVLNRIPGVHIGFNADDLAGGFKELAAANWAQGIAGMAGALKPVAQDFKSNFQSSFAEFRKAFEAAPAFLDDSESGAKLRALLGKLQTSISLDASRVQGAPLGAATAASATLSVGKLIASGLSSIGLGGLTSSSGASAQLNESRRQTRELMAQTAVLRNIAAGGGVVRVIPVAG